MEDQGRLLALLSRIESNQVAALRLQQQQAEIARHQFERAELVAAESLALQRASSRYLTRFRAVAVIFAILLVVLILYLMARPSVASP